MEDVTRDAETASSACQCYINTVEIKQGRWQEDPSECLRNCKAQFLGTVVKGWQENDGWVEGCGSLNRNVPVKEFWSLYWCDLTFCGVGINRAGGLGQDPTVDLIINTCQNIGFYSIIDPGPPPPNFTCSTEADTPKLSTAARSVDNIREQPHRARQSRNRTPPPGPGPPTSATNLPEPSFFTLPSPLPIPTRGSPASSTWPPPYSPPLPPPPHPSDKPSNNRGSGSASSCYTAGTTSSSTAHSSLRHHEIPIAIPFYMGSGVLGASGRGGEGEHGGESGERSTPRGSPLPSRPPRPHEGMLEVPGLVTPAVVGGGGGAAAAGEGGVATPPPPPPLSPPPTRALPKTPPASVSTPPPLVLPARGSARGSPAPGSASPPPAYSGRARGDGKSSQPGLLGLRGPGLAPAAGTETGSPYRHEHGRLAGYSPALEQAPDGAGGGSQPRQDSRGSWGSWSGAGTVVGSVNYHATSLTKVIYTKCIGDIDEDGW
ncbi:hypothetical protein B0I37DRAFT_404768 [Chaetomium sp. MPI-CAGE-AT-0009]|nr:hypothetical protein B0I37DRAFT_404768 [Chaetomium sp. MPI-CAGE-AT-0009]